MPDKRGLAGLARTGHGQDLELTGHLDRRRFHSSANVHWCTSRFANTE